jgi:hypothetical protein
MPSIHSLTALRRNGQLRSWHASFCILWSIVGPIFKVKALEGDGFRFNEGERKDRAQQAHTGDPIQTIPFGDLIDCQRIRSLLTQVMVFVEVLSGGDTRLRLGILYEPSNVRSQGDLGLSWRNRSSATAERGFTKKLRR